MSNEKYYLYNNPYSRCNKVPFVKVKEMNDEYFKISKKRLCYVCEFIKKEVTPFIIIMIAIMNLQEQLIAIGMIKRKFLI